MAISILKISGIGQATAATLADFGFKTAEDLAAAKVDQLSLVPGFGAIRAQSTIADAMSLVGSGVKPDEKVDDSGKKAKSSKKEEKKKKKKKKNKDKKSKNKKSKNKKSKNKKDKGGDKKSPSDKKKEKNAKKRKKGKSKRKK